VRIQGEKKVARVDFLRLTLHFGFTKEIETPKTGEDFQLQVSS
jgi:hypothetical protein